MSFETKIDRLTKSGSELTLQAMRSVVDERRFHQRYDLSCPPKLLQIDINGVFYSVADVSYSGLKVAVTKTDTPFDRTTIDDHVVAKVSLFGIKYEVELKLIRYKEIDGEIVAIGFQIQHDQDSLRDLKKVIAPIHQASLLQYQCKNDDGELWASEPVGHSMVLPNLPHPLI
jgi:hypothetical protein